MAEENISTLNHFTFFRYQAGFYELPAAEKHELNQKFWESLSGSADCVHLYQVYPTQAGIDFMAWSTVQMTGPEAAGSFFTRFAQATNPWGQWVRAEKSLWGLTRPSQYSKARSTQEIDPLNNEQRPYLVVYPFTKTREWYLMSREARQGMMNEHIRIGKQYTSIKQLLLYSFGLQDQEFVVIYDTDDLAQFSDLVYELRATEARRYTLSDSPLYTAIYHPPQETLALWE